MPQLNPNPWLFTMLTTWLTLLLLVQPKLLSFITTKPPGNKSPQHTKTLPWSWPWA